jgi:hypothetical protein
MKKSNKLLQMWQITKEKKSQVVKVKQPNCVLHLLIIVPNMLQFFVFDAPFFVTLIDSLHPFLLFQSLSCTIVWLFPSGVSRTLLTYYYWFVIPLFCYFTLGCFHCLDWYFPLTHLSCRCWS